MRFGITTMIMLGTLAAAPAHGAGALDVHEHRLDNGLRVLVIPQPHLPMVVGTLLVDAGSRFDPPGKEGLASLTAEVLTEGTAKRSRAEVHEAIDFLGARLSASATDDFATASLTVIERELDDGFGLLGEIVRTPAFDEAEVARKRAETLASIEAEDQDPGSVAARAYRSELYGDGAYRTPAIGTAESAAKLTRDDLVAFHRTAWRPERARLVIAGRITTERAVELADRVFGKWTGEGEPPQAAPSTVQGGPKLVVIDRDLTQASLIWGHGGTTRSDPDWYALQVMNQILGAGGFSSRLMKSIRTEAGLAYSVYSYFSGKKLRGGFQVALQTKNDTADEALALLRQEVERMRTEPVSDKELDEAKKYLTGSFPLRIDSNSKLVGFFSQIDYYDIGLDYPERYEELIESVTADEVLRVAKEYLHPEKAILVVVGKKSALPELAPVGP